MSEVGEALLEARLVTLIGAEGAGKTRLAREAAVEVEARHHHGVRWVDVAAATSRSVVAYFVIRAFGLAEGGDRPVLVTLCEQIVGSDALLVLDHCDDLIEGCADLVEALLRVAPKLQVLATCREPLRVSEELACLVPALDPVSASRLFTARAAQAAPGFGLDGGTDEAVARICRSLGGSPLAIELAAARVGTMPLARIAADLDDQLAQAGRAGPFPPSAVKTALAWSHRLLDEDQKAVLRRSSVFTGGFTLEAAGNVCAGGTTDPAAVPAALSRLVELAFMLTAPAGDEVRYHLPETIRALASAQLETAGESDATRNRHRDYFVGLAERAEPELVGHEGPRWLDRLERERYNLITVAEWCESSGAGEELLRLLSALTLFFELRSHLRAGGRWFARALAGEERPSPVRAKALWGAARIALRRSDADALGRYAPEALAVAEEVGDEAALCRALNISGAAAVFLTENVERGRAMLDRSAALGRGLGDDSALVEGLKLSSIAWMLQGHFDDRIAPLAEFRRVAERLGNRFLVAWYHTIVGWVRLQRGDFPRARQALEMAIAEDQELGGRASFGIPVALLGKVEALTGRFEAAERRLITFLERAEDTRDCIGAPWGLPILARLLVGLGRPEEARRRTEGFLERFRPLGVPVHVSDGLRVLGVAHAAAGDTDAAEAVLTEARVIAGTLNNPWLIANSAHHLGELARRRGDLVGAAGHHHEALTERARAGLHPGVAQSLERVAVLSAGHERLVDAARLFSAAAALRRGMSLARWPVDQPAYDADLAGARRGLGPGAWETAWAEGAALTVDDAVAYAGEAAASMQSPS